MKGTLAIDKQQREREITMTDHRDHEQTNPPHSDDVIVHDHSDDGIDRRGFLKCMAWAGTGLLCTVSGGLLSSSSLAAPLGYGGRRHKEGTHPELSFVQISDSHIGFSKAANQDVTATLQEAVAKINALPTLPAFLLHTGDLTQLSKPEQFDTVQQILQSAKTTTGRIFYVPGEHDVLNDNGAQFLARYGKDTKGGGWHSFDHSGVHFIGLVNVLNLQAGGLGSLGSEQLEWLEKNVQGLPSSTPIVVFAHIPLWSVYPPWGWGTDDSAQALGYLKRFGSVTVLNGHIHQTLQKVEGNVHFHTAMSTAFPQPAPGTAPSPGPMTVPAGQLRHVLGITQVAYVPGRHALALVDSPLQAAESAAA
jgi:3',5'-cyclic-AMP phosphodiesterase